MEASNTSAPLPSLKKQQKLKEFREYLADKGVVLSLVKLLISLRNSDTFPENPSEFIQDYFGRYKDPLWDEVERMKNDIQSLKVSIENKTKEIAFLHQEISKSKRIAHIKETFIMMGPDNNGIVSTKILVQKLSGQPRFEVDLKLNINNFINFVLEHLITAESEEEKNNWWSSCYLAFREMCIAGEDGKPKPPPFAGRLEDPNYQRILEKIRSFVPR
ncbi:hypothetical protein SteCoe_25365 [Stentor coeruleus]|uniref:Uncharacterized protein n=1 Tax=Stentor coeruleus TaxID=5963 RepID=A0A1R2BFG3_9CILI|nr:hypothetical protein SteCoe_25365 [Stentor coeruleus]